MYGVFQGGPQLVPHDAERRQSLGQLLRRLIAVVFGSKKKKMCSLFPVKQLPMLRCRPTACDNLDTREVNVQMIRVKDDKLVR